MNKKYKNLVSFIVVSFREDSKNIDDNTKYEEEEKWNQLTNAIVLVELTFYN